MALPVLPAKVTVSCALSITGRTVLAVGYKDAEHSESSWGDTEGTGRGAEAPRVRSGVCTWVRVCGGSGTNLHRGEGLCQSTTGHEPLW